MRTANIQPKVQNGVYAPSMPVDPALSGLAKTIEAGQPWPRPACPTCQTGYIGFSSPTEYEGHGSASARSHPAFEPEWISGTFVVRGQCENPDCQQAVHGTGDYRVDFSRKSNRDDEFDYQGIPYSSYYTVTHLHPPLLIMPIPMSAPDEVREGVLRASRVLFADPGLAATALRATVERFLTSEGIAAANSSGQFRTAHDRIDEWRDADPKRPLIADLFFAVKWLGNAGTHEDSADDHRGAGRCQSARRSLSPPLHGSRHRCTRGHHQCSQGALPATLKHGAGLGRVQVPSCCGSRRPPSRVFLAEGTSNAGLGVPGDQDLSEAESCASGP